MCKLPSLMLALGFGLLACAAPPPSPVDDHFGESLRTLTAQQVANPDAGDDTPVEGLGATSADHVTETYHERRSTPQQDQRSERSTLTLID